MDRPIYSAKVVQVNQQMNSMLDGMIMEGIGERVWNTYSKKKRKNIIIDTFNDSQLEFSLGLTKEEVKQVLQHQFAQEGF